MIAFPIRASFQGKIWLNSPLRMVKVSAELCHRTQPPLLKIISERKVGEIAIFAHAGVIRSFLALALDSKELALKFSIDNLSITAIEALSNGQFSISFVNQSV